MPIGRAQARKTSETRPLDLQIYSRIGKKNEKVTVKLKFPTDIVNTSAIVIF